MVKASIEGWQKYLTDPTASNEVILKNNKQGLDRDALVYGVEALKPLCTVNGDLTGVGQMTRERWVELSDTLVDLKLIDRAKVNVDASFNKDLLK
jgi:NitT/TauT family transport system substrate-binding protein